MESSISRPCDYKMSIGIEYDLAPIRAMSATSVYLHFVAAVVGLVAVFRLTFLMIYYYFRVDSRFLFPVVVGCCFSPLTE